MAASTGEFRQRGARRRWRRAVQGALLSAALGCVTPAWAGNDIFFVTYNHNIEPRETELMVMTDVAKPADAAEGGTYLAHMIELERGLTERWATEVMIEGYVDPGRGTSKFTGFRWENRYRLRKGRSLVPVLYAEYEDLDPATRFKMELSGREDGKGEPSGLEGRRERILETRLVLSQDFGAYNVALNWINETDLRRGAGGFTDFGYALGVRRALGQHRHGSDAQAGPPSGWRPTAVGLELYGGVGNSRAFGGPFNAQQHYVQPVVMFHPAHNVMLHVGVAVGLTSVSDTLVRTSLGFGF